MYMVGSREEKRGQGYYIDKRSIFSSTLLVLFMSKRMDRIEGT
jgi:hypothetical protein